MDWKTVNTNCYDKVVIPEEQKHTLAYISAIFDIFKEDGVCETCKHRDKSLDWHRLKGLSFKGHVNRDLGYYCYCNLYESD